MISEEPVTPDDRLTTDAHDSRGSQSLESTQSIGVSEDVLISPASPDLGSLLSQISQVRDAVQSAQLDAATQVVEGTAGGGAVRIQVTGGLDFRSVQIDPSVVDPADVELLADLVLAALRDAMEQANLAQAQALGGFDLGAIQGLLGGQ